ncbi:MAG: hypothetical protein U1E66_04060 [Rhodospirillales bacterium]
MIRAARPIGLALAVLLSLAGCSGDGSDDGDIAAAYNGNASALIGLDNTQVTRALGPADFQRLDGPAEILQYRAGTCVLDLYLYRDVSSGQFRVKHIEARDRSFASVAPDTCLSAVARNKRAMSSATVPAAQEERVLSS